LKKPRINLSTAILLSLGIGILVGIFFGESVGFLHIVGDAFIKLLQMTVLPYVTVSLIAGLGGLDYKAAGSIFKYGGMAILTLWLLTVIMIVVMPLAFPDWETATFFSTSLIEQQESVDILGLYIPANPFFSMANNIVPAVVLFSIALGIALMGVPGKEGFLENIKVLAAGLTRITNFVIRLTPIGVFAIAASAAGTLRPEVLEMLQVYGFIYVLTALVLAFWALPALVTSAMPLGYRDVIVDTRDILITAFATGSVFVVLPLLAERSKRLLAGLAREEDREAANSLVDVVVPTAYSFPSVGTVLILSFVLFAGWLSGTPVAVAQYPVFIVSGVLSVFGGVYIGIPFVLDMMRIPADTFNLLVIFNQVVSGRFGAMLASITILVITLLCAGAVGRLLKVRLRGVVRYLVVTGILMTVSITGVRVFFNHVVAHQYAGYQMFIDLELEADVVAGPAQTSTLESFPPVDREETAVERIRRRGKIRVGYLRDLLPWAFINSASHLVGFDVEMAHSLAHDLGVDAEFVRLEPDQMTDCLDAGYCDIIMSGIAITTDRAERMSFSTSYMDQTAGCALLHPSPEELPARRHHRPAGYGERVLQRREPRSGCPDLLRRGRLGVVPDLSAVHRRHPASGRGRRAPGLPHCPWRERDARAGQHLGGAEEARRDHPADVRILDPGEGRREDRSPVVRDPGRPPLGRLERIATIPIGVGPGLRCPKNVQRKNVSQRGEPAMLKRSCVVWMLIAVMAVGMASAADIGLTSVLYPDGKSIAVPIAGTQRAPAAQLSARVAHRVGQSSVEIQYKNLPPAVLFGGDMVSYVVWAVVPDGSVENLGGIANDGAPKGTARYATARREFALMITAEPIMTVRTPGDLVVFFSGTPAAKDVRPTGFTFGGLSEREGLVSHENDSIAGMTYKQDKKNPLPLIQAEKAMELLDRFDARDFDPDTYDGAMAALTEARDLKGKEQLDAANRSVVLAGQALNRTAQMMEAEQEAVRAAEKRALTAQASDLAGDLGAVVAKLEATEANLMRTEAELAKARTDRAKLTRQYDAMNDQLTGALGQMATGTKTDRGYVVSLSGVAFQSGKSELSTEAKYVLAKLSGTILVFPDMTLSAEGHTDSTGSEDFNRELSLARAEAVARFLKEMGVTGSRVTARGFGPDQPIAPNDTPEGRARNRRVDIVMTEVN